MKFIDHLVNPLGRIPDYTEAEFEVFKKIYWPKKNGLIRNIKIYNILNKASLTLDNFCFGFIVDNYPTIDTLTFGKIPKDSIDIQILNHRKNKYYELLDSIYNYIHKSTEVYSNDDYIIFKTGTVGKNPLAYINKKIISENKVYINYRLLKLNLIQYTDDFTTLERTLIINKVMMKYFSLFMDIKPMLMHMLLNKMNVATDKDYLICDYKDTDKIKEYISKI